MRRKVVGWSMTSKSWNNFLRINENKTKLFSFLAERIDLYSHLNWFVEHREKTFFAITILIDQVFVLAITKRRIHGYLFMWSMRPFTNWKNLLVISTDTNVVLAISMFEKLEKDRLWIAFGKVKDLRWIRIHGVSISLGPRALGVIFVHAHWLWQSVSLSWKR